MDELFDRKRVTESIEHVFNLFVINGNTTIEMFYICDLLANTIKAQILSSIENDEEYQKANKLLEKIASEAIEKAEEELSNEKPTTE